MKVQDLSLNEMRKLLAKINAERDDLQARAKGLMAEINRRAIIEATKAKLDAMSDAEKAALRAQLDAA